MHDQKQNICACSTWVPIPANKTQVCRFFYINHQGDTAMRFLLKPPTTDIIHLEPYRRWGPKKNSYKKSGPITPLVGIITSVIGVEEPKL